MSGQGEVTQSATPRQGDTHKTNHFQEKENLFSKETPWSVHSSNQAYIYQRSNQSRYWLMKKLYRLSLKQIIEHFAIFLFLFFCFLFFLFVVKANANVTPWKAGNTAYVLFYKYIFSSFSQLYGIEQLCIINIIKPQSPLQL